MWLAWKPAVDQAALDIVPSKTVLARRDAGQLDCPILCTLCDCFHFYSVAFVVQQFWMSYVNKTSFVCFRLPQA